jgi:L-iditol 2-dehydrogenase
MITAQLVAPRQFRFVEEDPGPVPPGAIRVKVAAVGVCGSDLHSYSEGAIGDSPCVYPMVLGHEPSGVVEAIGEGVTGWQPGDRAALEPALYCYHCEACRSGHHNICHNIRFLSNPGQPGFFRQYVDLPPENLLGIPDGLSLEEATMVEPLAVALHSMKFAAVGIGETVAVFGAGPIGLFTIACLKAAGAKYVYCVEPVKERRHMAWRVGADDALDVPNAAAHIVSDTGGRGVDCAIDCAARGRSTNEAIHAARNGGRVVLTGIHSEAAVLFETSPMRRKELTVFNVRRSNHESAVALELLADRIRTLGGLITHTCGMDQIGEAFELTAKYEDGVVKMIVKP